MADGASRAKKTRRPEQLRRTRLRGDSEKGDEEEVEFEVSLVFRSSVPGVRRAPAIISARILGPHRRSVQMAIEKQSAAVRAKSSTRKPSSGGSRRPSSRGSWNPRHHSQQSPLQPM
ncbi:hypothetical protein HPP92_006745 [Vanilla planifolia]|uniref:Uncharacterized protein n=1 Tax=Vanilla planifolia TaxID=51239 RepID=A0A835RFD1_VANPL|nr:hypothetical protein HPP92_006745 [Vanilla planifolia]